MKKTLYKENPKAELFLLRSGHAWYKSICSTGAVLFKVPFGEIGDTTFLPEMEGKHLIRWIHEDVPENKIPS